MCVCVCGWTNEDKWKAGLSCALQAHDGEKLLNKSCPEHYIFSQFERKFSISFFYLWCFLNVFIELWRHAIPLWNWNWRKRNGRDRYHKNKGALILRTIKININFKMAKPEVNEQNKKGTTQKKESKMTEEVKMRSCAPEEWASFTNVVRIVTFGVLWSPNSYIKYIYNI